MFELKTYLSAKQKEVNDAIDRLLTPEHSQSGRVYDAMRHSLLAGGKRIRPILLMASADAVAGHHEDAMAAAVALEMIHTYSLIHDDLPAMDDDDLRRGNPTCHIQFDEATAILAGDALLTHAFYLLSHTDGLSADDAVARMKIIRIISESAGIAGMIAGQMVDIQSEGTLLDGEQLRHLHSLKTGALIKASVIAGGMIGKADDETLARLSRYAEHIGLAFQVADDILNIEGDPKIMGKAVGTDQDRNKNTYPAILGLDQSKAFAQDLVSRALEALKPFDDKALPLRHIATYIIQRNK